MNAHTLAQNFISEELHIILQSIQQHHATKQRVTCRNSVKTKEDGQRVQLPHTGESLCCETLWPATDELHNININNERDDAVRIL